MQKVFWSQGAKVVHKSFAPPKTSFAPVQPRFVLVQEAFCSRGAKDLLHPLQTTLETVGAMIWGGAKRMGGGKRIRERALPKNSGPLQKSCWSAKSWIFVQNRATTPEGVENVPYEGCPNPLFGRGVIREVFRLGPS